MNKTDFLIIGGGPAGYETAIKARERGHSVRLIEKAELGGTCLNRGCIPTKALCRSAEIILDLQNASVFGLDVEASVLDFGRIMQRKESVVATLREGVSSLLKEIDIVKGEATFVDAVTVEVDGRHYTADKIIIATGSQPSVLNIPGKEYALTSDDILSLTFLPESIVIIGGGVIGMEFASIFAALGSKVTVLEYCKEILPAFDSDIAKRSRMSLKRRGIDIITGAEVKSVSNDKTVSYINKGKEKSVSAECILFAVGRKPLLPKGLEKTGIKVEKGAIMVDDEMRCLFEADRPTPDAEFFAIGDVNGRCMLAHAATMQGEVALGLKKLTDVIPSAVFTHPECAMVGLTEEQCHDQALDIKIGKSTFASNGKAVAMGQTEGLVKLIVAQDSGKLLGCHICGPHAADLIQEASVIISQGSPVSVIENTVHPHPTLSEAIKAALPNH